MQHPPTPSRRAILLGGLGLAGWATTACSGPSTPAERPSPTTSALAPPEQSQATEEFTALESTFGGRVGVYAVDTATGRSTGHRADERFLMCSTAKVLMAAAALRATPDLMDRLVRYTPADLVAHSPVTEQHVGTGMTVAALCEATLTVSDNTAANLILSTLGGPQAVTDYVRTLDDPTTRLDRTETALNTTTPEGLDTSTPAAFAQTTTALLVDGALPARARDTLTAWMKASTTGLDLIRAALPPTWTTADKSGSGAQGEVNNVAVTWPPNGKPWVVAVFTAPDDPESDGSREVVARAAAIALKTLG
ncbi:class A beta-lactamase [Actinokineospora pegani]|uniref:class A beta-lactamase n=1 Tax=Actinokineospora pegani TaxID=2654637 RepID=UPI0018D2D73C|nr:class A beta-lactamase [Actinokineospora pegani]